MKARQARFLGAAFLTGGLMVCRTRANPTGATFAPNTAAISTSGSHTTIVAADKAFISWQSFNIGVGETTTFVQPSANSVVWNQINDPNASQIMGTLNANGYVVLQNQSGFVIGGQATITAHGLVMTTATIPTPDLGSGGPWQFNAPPPSAKIINYGSISTDNGGSLFLIAHDIDNEGTLSAPHGNVGLYAGQQVLVSERPDGRGLSAAVTLPEGSVDNTGRLIADAGSIVLQAQVVNQGGLLQANSIRNVNGTIELLASDAVNLSASSVISAQGDSSGVSSGGAVTVKSDNTFSDEAGSAINIAGGAQGGNGGQVELSAPNMTSIQSSINGQATTGFTGGALTIDPNNIKLVSGTGDTPPANGTVAAGDPNSPGSPDTLTLDVTKFPATLSQINLAATGNIELATIWTLRDVSGPASLTLTAGNNIFLDNGSGINAVLKNANNQTVLNNNWSITLNAGPQGLVTRPATGADSIYLRGNAFIQSQHGYVTLWAANDVLVDPGALNTAVSKIVNSGTIGSAGNNGIRTLEGGNIMVTAALGDVNTGGNVAGFLFGQSTAPFYLVSQTLGGISTAAGGNVTINAGQNMTSFLPVDDSSGSGFANAQYDGGAGAFGPQAGDVSITAGGNISGHFVLANGTGTIKANGNIGDPTIVSKGFALSLVKGNWTVSAGKSLYVQDINNPNGNFNGYNGQENPVGYNIFDYDPNAAVTLKAVNNIEITGAGAPHFPESDFAGGLELPFIFPPNLTVNAGGSFTLDQNVTLFPSIPKNVGDPVSGNLTITTGGDFTGSGDGQGNFSTLMVSDSPNKQWTATGSDFTSTDPNHASTPPELANLNLIPVNITVGGNMENLNLFTTAPAKIKVTGDMFNVTYVGQNLRLGDTTSITVTGKLSYPSLYAFVDTAHALTQAIASVDPLNPNAWDEIFSLLVDPTLAATIPLAPGLTLKQLATQAQQLRDFQGTVPNPGFLYDSTSLLFGYQGQMTQAVRDILDGNKGPLTIIKLDQFGNPLVQPGQASLGQDPTKNYFVTTTVNFVPASVIDYLFTASNDPLNPTLPANSPASTGLQVGGPGDFVVHAGTLDLGNTGGIRSVGYSPGNAAARDYSTLAGLPDTVGAAVDVTVDGNLSMLTSTIGSFAGGIVNVTAGGEIDLGLSELPFIPKAGTIAYGIYSTGGSDVHVTATGDVNILTSRIGTFNGGDVYVTSDQGNVNAGNGENDVLIVPLVYKDAHGNIVTGNIESPKPFGSGILALSPGTPPFGSGSLPGNITVKALNGDVLSTLGGIQQFALNRTIGGGPFIDIEAGTAPTDTSLGHEGNVDLGSGGVIGGTIIIKAQGDIKGFIVSRQDSTINAAQNFSGTVLSGGAATVSATAGSISGTVIGITGVTATGGQGVTADVLSQNATVQGQAAASTLGTTATATATSQSAASEANTETKQQVALTDNSDDDDLKKKGKRPVLTRRGRVTVILPKS